MNQITLHNISKSYIGKEFHVDALANINLTIGSGELIGIMGPSGSGKSTLLNIIGLIDSPTSGNYLIDNTDISQYNSKELAKLRNKTFGFILQDFALVERYTVLENVKIPLIYSDIPRKYWANRIESVLANLGIAEKKKMFPSQISGGQRQRVAIARALVNETQFILADEPTGALDTKTGNEIMSIFSEIRKTGTSIIIVTHDHSIAAKCDRIIEIHDGLLNG
jgi:putative ABC transport system ATP-binding protein